MNLGFDEIYKKKLKGEKLFNTDNIVWMKVNTVKKCNVLFS